MGVLMKYLKSILCAIPATFTAILPARVWARKLAPFNVMAVAIVLSGQATAQHTLDFVIPPCPTLSLVEPESPADLLRIYPNPVGEKLHLAFGKSAGAGHTGSPGQVGHAIRSGPPLHAEILFYNVLGRAVKQVELHRPASLETIDVSDLPPGLYVLRIRLDDLILHRKIVAEPPRSGGSAR